MDNQDCRRWALAIALICLPLGAVNAMPMLQVDSVTGKLTGATGVDVSGALYDVQFKDGACIALFSGCNDSSDFVFTTSSSAIAASQALLGTVLTDTTAGSFDSNPALTQGCTTSNVCEVFTPYAGDGLNMSIAIAINDAPTFGPDAVTTNSTSFTADFVASTVMTFAVWTPANPIPEPTPLALILAITLSVFGLRRHCIDERPSLVPIQHK